jgi:hypothetical protein
MIIILLLIYLEKEKGSGGTTETEKHVNIHFHNMMHIIINCMHAYIIIIINDNCIYALSIACMLLNFIITAYQ